MSYFLYIVECQDGSYYTGIATDVARPVAEHNGTTSATAASADGDVAKSKPLKGKGARYTTSRRPVRLRYQAPFANRSDAMKAEIRVKRLNKTQKDRLIAGDGAVSSRARCCSSSDQ